MPEETFVTPQRLFDGQFLGYARWFITHADTLKPLLDIPKRFADNESIVDHWEDVKWAGDLIVPVIGDLPDVVTADYQECAIAMGPLAVDAQAAGVPWAELIRLMPELIRLIQLIRNR